MPAFGFRLERIEAERLRKQKQEEESRRIMASGGGHKVGSSKKSSEEVATAVEEYQKMFAGDKWKGRVK